MRLLGYISLLLGILVWVYALLSPRGLPELLKLKILYGALQEDTRGLQEELEALKEEVYRLKADPLYLEYIARSQLGMVKKGEILFILPEETEP